MIQQILDFDTYLFRLINNARCSFLDCVLPIFSWHLSIGVIVTLITLYVMKQKHWKHWYLYIGIVALCFLLSDRISVVCFKDVFERLRPSHALEDVFTLKISHFDYITTNKGGLYGFVSSHAANIFSIITVMSLIMSKEKHALSFFLTVFLWALITGYSRIYCGYHYLGDVLCGALLGILIGYTLFLLYIFVLKKIEKKHERY
ncbi:MAG: phosphatase PAP2 family protein [Bacteroidales bacterium]|nr:phosphatase PAP2 family protein [Bacteroidales bacterium]